MQFKITVLQKILSYILPVTILKTKSKFNSLLEVAVENGKLVLNSANSNYSYGSLFKVFRKSFKQFNIKFNKINNVLMLGMGAGSVVKFIAGQNPKIKIDAVEIDESVIAIAEQAFELNTILSIKIIHSEAQSFLQTYKIKYDLILVDLFIDREVPSFCFEEVFVKQLEASCTSSAKIIFNMCMEKKKDATKNIELFQQYFKKVVVKTIKGNRILYAEV